MVRFILLSWLMAVQAAARALGRRLDLQPTQRIVFAPGPWYLENEPDSEVCVRVLEAPARFPDKLHGLQIHRWGPVVVAEERWHDGGGVTGVFWAFREVPAPRPGAASRVEP